MCDRVICDDRGKKRGLLTQSDIEFYKERFINTISTASSKQPQHAEAERGCI